MKHLNFTLLLVLLFISIFSFGQSQRLVLAEEFTNASCGPCASQNPAFDALLQQNTDKITSIKYHMSWPGTDPMYSQNTVDNNARRSVYGINSVPHVQMDGSWWDGMPSQVNQSRINSAYAVPASFEMQVQHQLIDNNQKIYVKTLVKATEDVNVSNLRLFVVVIEKHIHFNSPPGYNGEKDFYNVMKKILPDKNGYKLNSNISNGEYFLIENTWELANVYNNDELSVVAFIQDMSSKEVYQAANSSTDPIVLPFQNDVEITNIKYATYKNCSGTMTPVVEIRNNGSNTLTSMEVKYSVNNGEEHTYNWTGNAASLVKTEIPLTDLSFDVLDTNHLVINVTSVNNTNDEFVSNNNLDFEFYRADVVEQAYLLIFLDNHPEETTWKLFKSDNSVVQEGGPYSGTGQKVIPLEFNGSGCYRLEMYDAGGDGFTGSGKYIVAYGDNSISFEGKNFTDKDINEKSYDIVGVNNQVSDISNLNIYPNPATDKIHISFYLLNKDDIGIDIIDMHGRVIKQINKRGFNPGNINMVVDINDLVEGLYLVKITAGNQIKVSKISVK